MYRTWTSVCHAENVDYRLAVLFFVQFVVIVLVRTNFTTPTTLSSLLLLPRIVNQQCVLPQYKHTHYNYYAFNFYVLIKLRLMISEAEPLHLF